MKRKRTLSILLVLTLLVTCAPWTAAAAASTEESVGTEAIAPITEQPVVEETQLPLLEADTVPETMEYADAVAQDHILRLYGEEGNDLNRVVFLNRDGSRTMYLYDFPVKYVDSDGIVRDISLDIADSNTPLSKYETAANSIVTSFSEKLSDGISLTGNGVSVRLVPVQPALQPGQSLTATADAIAQRIDSKTVEYRYDANTTIEYSLTYTGFKEDIVVSEYTGQTEYHFFLYTGGLTLTQLDGSYFLTDEDGTIKASIGEIIVFTADERNNTFGQLEAEPIKDQEIYLLTIVLDAEYLSDPNTAYPIRIDPDIRIDHDLYGSAAIEDVTIQSASASQGEFTASIVGVSQKGVSRLLLRILDAAYDFSELEGATVTSAWINLRDLMCESTPMTVTCYPYTGTPWTESTAQWSTLNQSWGEALDSYAISYSNGLNQYYDHWYRFHIESLVQAWIDGEADQNQGVIFKADEAVESGSTLLYKTIGSYERSAYKPSFVMTYTSFIRMDSYMDLSVEESRKLSAITFPSGQELTWRSLNPEIAVVNEIGVVTGIKTGIATIEVSLSTGYLTYCIVNVHIANGVYYIRNLRTDYYLQTNGHITEDTMPSQGAKLGNNETEYSRVCQMWKITYLGYNYYSIRPMNKLDMGLSTYTSGGDVHIQKIGVEEISDQIADNVKWQIEGDLTECVFKNRGFPLCPENSNLGAKVGVSSTGTLREWTLTKVEVPPIGAVLYDKSTQEPVPSNLNLVKNIEHNKSYELNDWHLVAIAYSGNNNSQQFNWTSSNPNVVTVNRYSGKITAVSIGDAQITGTSANGMRVSISFHVNFANGTYYIQNKYSGKYAYVLNEYADGNYLITQQIFQGLDSHKWIFERTPDGYYTIKSVDLAGKWYLSIEADTGQVIISESTQIMDSMKWHISTTTYGAYKLVPKFGIDEGYALSLDQKTYADGVPHLVYKVYSDDYDREDEWILNKVEVRLDVAYEEQGGQRWCWAACARMFAKYYYPSVTVTQKQMVLAIKKSCNGDERGCEDDTEKAIEFYISDIEGAALDITKTDRSIYSEENLVRFLDEGHIILITLSKHIDFVLEGHEAIICGYTMDGSTLKFIIADPSPDAPSDFQELSYSKLCCGYGEGLIWYGAIVINTSYADETTDMFIFGEI